MVVKNSTNNPQTLILVATKRCNLDCDYCPVEKEDDDMSLETAQSAVFLLLKAEGNKKIRFFGGEPFLNFSLIKKIVERATQEEKIINFDVTTNGLLLNDRHFSFLKKYPQVELIVSSNHKDLFKDNKLVEKIINLPNITVNFNLKPSNLNQSFSFFKKLVEKGFSRFNFLPVYYSKWTKEEIEKLDKVFKKISQLINKHPSIEVKNLDIFSPVPLFNPSLVADCNGDLYISNFFMDKRLKSFKDNLKLGSVDEFDNWEVLNDKIKNFPFQQVIKKSFSNSIIKSTNKVDSSLTNFCKSIEK